MQLGFLTLLSACSQATAPDPDLHHRLGAVAARVNGQAWSSTYPLYGTIGTFDPQIGRLTIRASRFINHVQEEEIILSTCPVAGQSNYGFAASNRRTIGSWTSGGLLGSRSPLTAAGHYQSTGAEGDVLHIAALELAPAPGYVEGQFRMTARTDEGKVVVIAGSFAGMISPGINLPICD